MKPNYLKNIPQNWQIKKLKYLFKNVIGGVWGNEAQNDENDFICIRVADFNYEKGEVKKNKKFTLRNIKDSEQKNRILEKGDLLLEKSGGGEKTPVGRIVIFDLDKPAVCSNFINLLKVQKEYESTFLNYYFAFLYEKGVSKKYINQTTGIQNLNTSAFFDEKIILPPLSEQQKIANFLDKKTTELDTLIKKKKKLIKLLQEDEKAFINEKLTDTEGKWEKKKLKYVVSSPLMYGANEIANEDDRNQPRYIRITDFGKDGYLRSTTFKSLSYEIAKNYLLNDGDILFARSGATVGKTFQFKNYNGIACFAGYLIKATPNTKIILSDFLYYFTKSGYYENWKDSIFVQATIQNIGADKYSNMYLPCPSIEEQKKIVSEIENHIHKNRQVLEKLSKEVDLLREYRQSLISEAVTGQLVI